MLPRNGSWQGGPVKRRQKKQLKMRGRSVVAARSSSLLDTEAGGESLPLGWSVTRKVLVVFHLLFIWMLSLLLVCLLSWNSVISLILKFKYINFYLVYRYLFDFSVGEFVCECVWGCVMHVAYCMRTSEGMWSFKKKKTRWCTGSVDGLRFLQKQSETFWFLPLSVLWFVFCQSVSLLWSLAQYE